MAWRTSCVATNPSDEALYLANRDKESILRRLDTDLEGLRAQTFSQFTINGQIAHGLRKAGATIAAENGATLHQLSLHLMSMYDWETRAIGSRT